MLWHLTLQVLYKCKLCFCEEVRKEDFVEMNEKTFQWLTALSRIFFRSGQVSWRNLYPYLSTRVYLIASDEKVLVNFNGSSYLFSVIQHCLWNHLSRSSSSFLAFTINARPGMRSQGWTSALNVVWWRQEKTSKVFRGSCRVKKWILQSFRIFSYEL